LSKYCDPAAGCFFYTLWNKKADDLRHLFFPDAFVLYYCKANKCIWQDIFYSFYYFLQLFTKPLQILQGFCAFSHVLFIFMKQIVL